MSVFAGAPFIGFALIPYYTADGVRDQGFDHIVIQDGINIHGSWLIDGAFSESCVLFDFALPST